MHKRALNKTNKNDATAAAAAPPHFGHCLKQERLAHGLSIEDISEQTGIKPDHLLALEEGERRKLPADAFSRGFIRIYAEALGLDPKSSLESYAKEWGFSNGMQGAENFLGGENMAESTSPFADYHVLSFLAIAIVVASAFLGYKMFFPQYGIHSLLPKTFQSPSERTTEVTTKQADNGEQRIKEDDLGQTDLSPTPQENLQENQTSVSNQNIESTPSSSPPSVTPSVTASVTASDREADEGLPDEPEEVHSQDYSDQEIASVPPLPAKSGDNVVPSSSAIGESSTLLPTEAEDQQIPLEVEPIPLAFIDPLSAAQFSGVEQPDTYVIQALFKERTWLRINIDDQEPAEYTFKPGESHTWKAARNIHLFLGNAGGVGLSLNGVPFDLDKKSGQTLKISIP